MTAQIASSANSPMLREYLNPLLQWLRDENLTEICINRPDELWIEDREGWKSHPLDMSFRKCMHLARLVATHNNKAVTENSPVFSGSLPEGERIQVIIPPACTPGTVSFTIRKPSMTDMTLDDLEIQGTFAECAPVKDDLQPFEHQLMSLRQEGRIGEFLDLAVRNRRNILIAGKTGSGNPCVLRLHEPITLRRKMHAKSISTKHQPERRPRWESLMTITGSAMILSSPKKQTTCLTWTSTLINTRKG